MTNFKGHLRTVVVSQLVRAVGIEPTLLSEPDFESGASTSSTTPATERHLAQLLSQRKRRDVIAPISLEWRGACVAARSDQTTSDAACAVLGVLGAIADKVRRDRAAILSGQCCA